MNEYEKKCAFIIFDLGLNRAPSKIPNTMWKYIKKILIKLDEKNLVKYLSKYYKTTGRQFSLLAENRWSYGDETLDYIKNHFNLYEKELIQDDDFYKFVKYFKKWEEKPKYFIGKEETVKIGSNEYKCYRVIANKDIPALKVSKCGYQLIKKGTPGGCIQNENNLSHTGFCWLNDESCILNKARLEGNSYLYQSKLYGHAKIEGYSRIAFSTVCQNVNIKGNNDIRSSKITGNVIIQDTVSVSASNIFDNVEIFGNSYVHACNISENIWIENASIHDVNIKGNQKIKGENFDEI